MGIFSNKKNEIFDIALRKVKSMNESLNSTNTELERNKWYRILPNDNKSPMIMGMGENEHMIFYPAHSTPYLHQYEKTIKFVEILSGKLTDKLTGKTYEEGYRFKIYPSEEIQPYTGNVPAYVRVKTSKIDDIWDSAYKQKS